MDLGLHDHIILVTGGAKGIGAQVAKALAAEGAIPVIVGHNAADAGLRASPSILLKPAVGRGQTIV